MKRLKHRWERFKVWRQFCRFGKIKQWLIFLHIIHNGWFESFEID